MGAIFVTHEFSVKYEDNDSAKPRTRKRERDEEWMSEHYRDSFIMDLVDPIGASARRFVESRRGEEKWPKDKKGGI